MHYEATIEDPKVFTRPWKISMPIYRRAEKNLQLLDYDCVDFFWRRMAIEPVNGPAADSEEVSSDEPIYSEHSPSPSRSSRDRARSRSRARRPAAPTAKARRSYRGRARRGEIPICRATGCPEAAA